jgi:acetyl-CoA carboxylase biotin carboxyl carrier protein
MTDVDKDGVAPGADLARSVCDQAHDLVKRLEGSTVRRLRVEAAEFKIEIERRVRVAAVGTAAVSAAVAEGATLAPADGSAEQDGRHPIVSPLVGTFYGASEPGARAFVEVGDAVDEGQTVAIVEAMKLMNHVKADEAGLVAEIAVADGDWVEFEQVLMYLEPLSDE